MNSDSKGKKDEHRFIPKKPDLTEATVPDESVIPEPDAETVPEPEDEAQIPPPPEEPPAPGEGP